MLQREDVLWQFDAYAACNFQWYLKYANILLRPEEVVDGIAKALEHIRVSHARHASDGIYFSGDSMQ